MPRDPYRVLGVSPSASSEELHDAYRRLVKLHHPDRNGGSEASARKFAEVQEAYEAVRSRPRTTGARTADSIKERMVNLERELREAQAARERARQAARDAVRDSEGEAPPPEPLEDSIGKILGDLRDEVTTKVADGLRHPAVKRVGDLIEDAISRVDRR